MKRLRQFAVFALALVAVAGCAAGRLHQEGLGEIEEGHYEEGIAKLSRAAQDEPSNMTFRLDLATQRIVSGFVNGREAKQAVSPETLVTSRERQVLTRIAQGHSNKIIARELGLSVKTVEKHRSNLMRKLTLHNAAAVTLFALRHGFIEATGTLAQRSQAVV